MADTLTHGRRDFFYKTLIAQDSVSFSGSSDLELSVVINPQLNKRAITF